MRYLLCALAVLTVTACAAPPLEPASSEIHPPASGSGPTSGSGSDPNAGSGSDSGSDSGSGSTPAPGSTSGSGSRPGATSGSDQDRMIGFRLKRLDQLIETTFDRLLGNAGLNRREWQTLNTISRGPVDEAQLIDALRPFWEANGESVSDVVGGVTARGWVDRDGDGRYTLTASGRSAHRAAAAEVGSLRERMTEGVSPQEFSQLMDVLHRMIVNLETP